MRHSLFRFTCLGLLFATLAATNPISDFRIRARALNFAEDGEKIAQNVKISEVSEGLDHTKVNLVKEKGLSESERSSLLSKHDQDKINELEKIKTNSMQTQSKTNEKSIHRSESSSSSSSESETEENLPKETKKPSLLEQFKQIYQNWKNTIISNWKKLTSMRPLEKEEIKTYPGTKPGTYKHWYRTSNSILARFFRGFKRYFTLNKPQPVKGPLKPKVVETPVTPETKVTESSKEIPTTTTTTTESKEIEKPKDTQVGSEIDSKKTS